jgi:hypothetical protein
MQGKKGRIHLDWNRKRSDMPGCIIREQCSIQLTTLTGHNGIGVLVAMGGGGDIYT